MSLFRSLGRLEEARKAYEESLAIRRRIGAEIYAGESQVALAVLALEQGRRDEAEALARQALSTFEKKGALENEALAAAVLGRVLLVGGRSW
jgi:tetratricopeptide (TPR) repeat protein